MAGLLPFQLTPNDYEFYDAVSGNQKKESKEEKVEVEETLSEKLNKENEASEDDVSSEDFMKLMHLLSAEEKEEKDVEQFLQGIYLKCLLRKVLNRKQIQLEKHTI